MFDRWPGGIAKATSLLLVLLIVSGCVGDLVDRGLNKTYRAGDRPTAGQIRRSYELHSSLLIIDLHADPLLWDRDLLKKSNYGHVDLPRLVRGNVAIQVFGVVTKVPIESAAPKGAQLPSNARKCPRSNAFNLVGILQLAQMRPPKTWFDLKQRALYQASRLRQFAARSRQRHARDPSLPYLKVIRNVEDLRTVINDRRKGIPVVGAVLALEGAHWIGLKGSTPRRIEQNVKQLFDAGFRMVAPTHQFDNKLGSSSEGCNRSGSLSQNGLLFLKVAESMGMVLDLAHTSDMGIMDGAKGRVGPIVISHTGVRSACDAPDRPCDLPRNIPDIAIQAVARADGIVGIGYWPAAVGRNMTGIARAFASAYRALNTEKFRREMEKINGKGNYDPFDHLALGADFDGAVQVPFGAARLIELTAVLANYSEKDNTRFFSNAAIQKIAGRNACRVLATRLPGGDAKAARSICYR